MKGKGYKPNMDLLHAEQSLMGSDVDLLNSKRDELGREIPVTLFKGIAFQEVDSNERWLKRTGLEPARFGRDGWHSRPLE